MLASVDAFLNTKVSLPMLDINEIRQLLPHQRLLLVDRVESLDLEQKSIKAYKNVSINEPFFNGHFATPDHAWAC